LIEEIASAEVLKERRIDRRERVQSVHEQRSAPDAVRDSEGDAAGADPTFDARRTEAEERLAFRIALDVACEREHGRRRDPAFPTAGARDDDRRIRREGFDAAKR
jgi:riboflavin biosynthesis pyrimidine reductase